MFPNSDAHLGSQGRFANLSDVEMMKVGHCAYTCSSIVYAEMGTDVEMFGEPVFLNGFGIDDTLFASVFSDQSFLLKTDLPGSSW